MYHTMLSGCGKYIQGQGILSHIGDELSSLRLKHPFIIGGKTALSVTAPHLNQSLDTLSIPFDINVFTGNCTDKIVHEYSSKYKTTECDCIIGIGGGKVLDTAKAVANDVKSPIICIPTSAATCAATTPLSVMYSESGKQIRIDFFNREVNTVLVDMDIITQSPVRLTAAGIADSLAKLCEYSSPSADLQYGEKSTGLFCGYTLSKAANDILLQSGAQACLDIKANLLSQAVEDCVFVNIGLIGVISGLGGYGAKGKGRFAIAHALNELMRIHYPKIASNWLHGEIVGVGVLAQLTVNRAASSYIQQTRNLLNAIGSPDSLQSLGFPTESDKLDTLVGHLISCTSSEDAQNLLEVLTEWGRS